MCNFTAQIFFVPLIDSITLFSGYFFFTSRTTMRFSVKVGELEVNVEKALSPSHSPSTVFDLAAADLRAVFAGMELSDFEMVDAATAHSPGSVPVSGHFPVDPPTSSGRVSVDRSECAFGCGQACARLLEGQRADFPRDAAALFLRSHS